MKKTLSIVVIAALLCVFGASALVSAQETELVLWVYDDVA